MSTAASPAIEFLTVPEVARRLRVHEATIYRRVSAGEIPAVRVGEHGPLRIPADEFEAWLFKDAGAPLLAREIPAVRGVPEEGQSTAPQHAGEAA